MMRRGFTGAALIALSFAIGCRAELPSGSYSCADRRCPPGQFCDPVVSLCYSEPRRGLATRSTDAAVEDAPDAAESFEDASLAQDASVAQTASDSSGPIGVAPAPPGELDIDECLADLDDCDDQPDACVNVPGAFFCKCPTGYAGSGVGNTCWDIDECQAGTHNCDRDPQACVNDPGGFHCTCPSGFAGAGRGPDGCTDIDECSSKDNPARCDTEPNACKNTRGGYVCMCPSGYTGAGVGDNGCVDIDECAVATDFCDNTPDACINTVGGFRCECPSGYEGKGVGEAGCTTRDVCQGNPCGAYGTCEATATSYRCNCDCGFRSDVAGAACAFAPMSTIGNAELIDRASANGAADTVFAQRITGFSSGSRLLRFGVVVAGAGAGTIRLALYEDSAGVPGALLAQSATGLASSGTLQPAMLDSCPVLSSGAYWIAVHSDAVLDVAANSQTAVPTFRQAFAFANGQFPATLREAVSANGPSLSLYIVAQSP
jgi:hypothetical protein